MRSRDRSSAPSSPSATSDADPEGVCLTDPSLQASFQSLVAPTRTTAPRSARRSRPTLVNPGRSSRKRRLIALVALALVAGGVLIPRSPLFIGFPTRDPGIFLYVGDQILEGKIPYR